MERVTQALFVCLVNIIIAVAFVIMGCTNEPITTTTTTTTTPPTTTTTTTPPTTTTTTTPPTTTTATNTGCLVLNLAAPDAVDKLQGGQFSIYLIVTNTRNSQVSCDIPIIITSALDQTLVATYVVSVTLGPNETKEFVYDATMEIGYYVMQAGDVIKPLQVG